jgi:hypothetical protein
MRKTHNEKFVQNEGITGIPALENKKKKEQI